MFKATPNNAANYHSLAVYFGFDKLFEWARNYIERLFKHVIKTNSFWSLTTKYWHAQKAMLRKKSQKGQLLYYRGLNLKLISSLFY